MNPPSVPSLRLSENGWRGIILALSVAVLALTVWCLANGITTVFMHLYYFPIVLLAYRYRWKGFGLATLLTLAYLGLSLFFGAGQPDVLAGALYRSLAFVGIAGVIAWLSHRLGTIQDSLQTADELRERYISLAPAIILALDRQGRVTRLNEKGCAILGWARQDVEGKPFVDTFIPAEDRRSVRTMFERIIRGETVGNAVVEANILTGDGSVRVIRWNNTILKDNDGSITGTLSYGEDITEEKRVRDNLRKLQQFQESVITNANVWISVLAPDGSTLLLWNDAAEAISGYKKGDVVGKNTVWKQLYPDKTARRRITGDIQRIIGRDQFLENFETEIQCADGTMKTIVWNTRGLRDRDGDISSYIVIGRDISAQKAAEIRAAESARFLGTMIDSLPIPLFFKDREGRYLGCNTRFEEFIGMKRDQIAGKTAYDILPKDLADLHTPADRQVFENPGQQHYETEVQYADGSPHTVIFYKAPFFSKDGSVGGLIGAYLDITDRKKAEQDLIFRNALFSAETEAAPDGILIVDENQKILLANRRFHEMWEVPEDLITGGVDAPVLEYVLTKVADQDEFLLKVQDLYEHRDAKSREEIVLADGRIFDRYSAPVIGSDKRYYGRIWFFRDITETKRAEAAIRQGGREWQATFDAITDVVFLLDGNGRITRHNRSFENFTGKRATEIEGRYCHEVLHGTSYPICDCPNIKAKSSRVRESIELDIKSRWYIASVDPIIAENGELAGAVHLIIDITERKRLEESLSVSEERLRLTLDASNDGIWDWDLSTGKAVFSSRWYTMLGYAPDELPGSYETWRSLIHPDDLAPAEQMIREHTGRKDAGYAFEVRMRTKEGEWKWILTRGKVVEREADGNPLRMVGTHTDITERKLAEERLRESEERFRTIFDNINDAVHIHEIFADGRPGPFIDVNEAACHMLMTSCDDLLRHTPLDYATEYHRPPLAEVLRKLHEIGTATFETGHRRTDGAIVPVEINAHVITLMGKTVVLSVIRDITERKRAEEALRNSRQILEGILNTIPVRVFWKDKDLNYMGCNTPFAHDAGFGKPEDLIGKNDYSMGWKDQADLYRADDRRVIESGQPKLMIEEPQTTPDGNTRYLLTSKLPLLDANGNAIGVLGTYLDVTDRKQAEEALRESRQLFSDIISFLPDPTFVIDKDGRVLAWNRAMELLSGVAAADIIGKGNHEYSIWMYGARRPILIDLVLHPDEDAGRLSYTNIRWERRSVTAQAEITRPGTGRKVTLSLVVSPLMDAQGKIAGAIESLRDISRLKEAEAELSRINQNLETIVSDRTRALEEEVAQRMRAEREVHDALIYTRSVIEANPDLMAVLDRHGTILDVNAAVESLTGLTRDQLIGTSYFSYLVDDGTRAESFLRLLVQGKIENILSVKRTDGHLTPMAVNTTVIGERNAADMRIIVAGHDITRQKQDEAVIKASLEEKVILLREIHHRVKNNLQIIISLTNLQMRQTEDPGVKTLMAETQNRVRAMSLVHEKLYRSESLSQIDFADYTRFLATQLFSFFGMDTRRVHLDLAIRSIMVDINTAVPLGLIMNELVSNALKHAFPGERQGTISITGGDEHDLITLVVRDNGVGFPPDFDWKNTTSLGMRLVNSLIDQVDGTITLDRGAGTAFTISVKREAGTDGKDE